MPLMQSGFCLGLAVAVMTITSCTDSTKPAVPATVGALSLSECEQPSIHTDYYFDSTLVRIFEPDNPDAPAAWQGPICVADKNQIFKCIADLSLVKKVSEAQIDGKTTVVIDTFSGSEAQRYLIDVETCKVILVED